MPILFFEFGYLKLVLQVDTSHIIEYMQQVLCFFIDNTFIWTYFYF